SRGRCRPNVGSYGDLQRVCAYRPSAKDSRPARRPHDRMRVSMLLHLSTWMEIEDYLKRSKTVVIPIGSNEQHGPTGLLGTDWLCPEIIAHEAQKTADIRVAPTSNIGMAQHHLGFAGSISLRPSTFMAAIGDWCRSLGLASFEK